MINLADLLDPGCVAVLEATDKASVLEHLADLLAATPAVGDSQALLGALKAREEMMSTGLGFGIAVPHCRIDSVSELVMAVGVSPRGIDYGSLDDEPVHIVVMIAAGAGQHDQYIRTLARMMLLLKNAEVRRRLVEAGSADEIYRVFADF